MLFFPPFPSFWWRQFQQEGRQAKRERSEKIAAGSPSGPFLRKAGMPWQSKKEENQAQISIKTLVSKNRRKNLDKFFFLKLTFDCDNILAFSRSL